MLYTFLIGLYYVGLLSTTIYLTKSTTDSQIDSGNIVIILCKSIMWPVYWLHMIINKLFIVP
jgi:hypothetical protein